MKLYLKKDVRELESYLINDLGVSSLILMEHAARSVYDVIEKKLDIKKEHFILVTGQGNNGGDAYALARILLIKGAKISVLEALGEAQSPDALIEKELLIKTNKLNFIQEKDLQNIIKDSVVIDGVFGIGFHGVLSPKIQDLFKKLNLSKYIISIDVPSGIDVDTGRVAENSIKADLTVSFFLGKQGLCSFPASLNVGKLIIKDLFLPQKELGKASAELITKEQVKTILKKIYPRQLDANKGTFGKLGIVVASKGFEGATRISSKAALKSGVGLLSVLSFDRTVADIRNSINLPMDVIVEDVSLEKSYSKYDVILIGPGLGDKKEFLTRLVDFALKEDKILIFDADALNIAAKEPELLSKMRKIRSVFTPHPKEMASLNASTVDEIQNNRLVFAKQFVGGSKMILVLKGANTILVDDSLKTYINPFAVPSLATAGSGDFLSGLIAGFITQGLSIKDASIVAVYLHAEAGKMYSKKYPDFTMTIDKLEKYFVKAVSKLL